MEVRLPVLLCAVKTVEGDFRFRWTTSICKALFHICDLDVSSVPTNFGLGFCIEFTGTILVA